MIPLNQQRPILLIDVMSEAFRAFYSVPRTIFSQDGRLINALVGFHNSLRKLLHDFKPAYCAVAWSCNGRTFRHQLFPTYKAHRAQPEPLLLQKKLIASYLQRLGIPQYSCEALEADDILATMARHFDDQGYFVILDTVDKDLYAVSSERVKIWVSRTKTLWAPQQVTDRFGVPPSGLADLLALIGDKTDAIPRIPEFSRREAIELINRFGSIRVLLEGRVAELPRSQQEKLERNRDLIERNLQLTVIRTDAPINIGPISQSMEQVSNAIALVSEKLRVKDLTFLNEEASLESWHSQD